MFIREETLLAAMGSQDIEYLIAKAREELVTRSCDLFQFEKDNARDQPIVAIKALRARMGLGLKEAKDKIDAYRATLPPKPFNP